MLVSDGYGPRKTEHVSLHRPTAALFKFVDRAFAAKLWNSLLVHLWDADLSCSGFWHWLKTFLFAVWTTLIAPPRNNRTYLGPDASDGTVFRCCLKPLWLEMSSTDCSDIESVRALAGPWKSWKFFFRYSRPGKSLKTDMVLESP